MVTLQVYFIPNLHILDWFQGYNIKPVSGVYRTSNSDYGSRPPSVHTMPTKFAAKSQKFSEVRFSFNFLLCWVLVAHTCCSQFRQVNRNVPGITRDNSVLPHSHKLNSKFLPLSKYTTYSNESLVPSSNPTSQLNNIVYKYTSSVLRIQANVECLAIIH